MSATNPVASRFATRFLLALTRINRRRPSRSSPSTRRRRVRIAADASMALAAGPTMAWSRAVLLGSASKRRRRFGNIIIRKSSTAVAGPNTAELKKLVPGGEEMDTCSLLDETAHYIECLKTQVQVMKTIASLFSDNSKIL